MKFTLEINCNNAAFRDPDADDDDDESPGVRDATRAEIARILRNAADHVEAGSDGRMLRDTNGNRVGQFDLS